MGRNLDGLINPSDYSNDIAMTPSMKRAANSGSHQHIDEVKNMYFRLYKMTHYFVQEYFKKRTWNTPLEKFLEQDFDSVNFY